MTNVKLLTFILIYQILKSRRTERSPNPKLRLPDHSLQDTTRIIQDLNSEMEQKNEIIDDSKDLGGRKQERCLCKNRRHRHKVISILWVLNHIFYFTIKHL